MSHTPRHSMQVVQGCAAPPQARVEARLGDVAKAQGSFSYHQRRSTTGSQGMSLWSHLRAPQQQAEIMPHLLGQTTKDKGPGQIKKIPGKKGESGRARRHALGQNRASIHAGLRRINWGNRWIIPPNPNHVFKPLRQNQGSLYESHRRLPHL